MNRIMRMAAGAVFSLALLAGVAPSRAADAPKAKKVVLVAGTPSHGRGEHEFNAGTILMKKCLDQTPGIDAQIYLNGWPKDPAAFDGADSIVLYMDGGAGHPVIQADHLQKMGELMAKGVGLVCLHYAVEVPKDKGGPEYLKWIGGYYETDYSINPHWTADLVLNHDHPVMRGVEEDKILDEWYYNMRWPEDLKNVIPVLKGTPPDVTRKTPASKANPGRIETLAWAIERPDGGRGFGFTGGHFHKNWANENFRRLVLNAILWSAKAEVPAEGVQSKLTEEELKANLDQKK